MEKGGTPCIEARMDQLLQNLATAHRKHVSEAVWRAVESVEKLLACFRAQVGRGQLVFRDDPAPHYVFDPSASYGEGETGPGAEWEKYSAYVLDVLRASTGMDVRWPGPGAFIELHLPSPDPDLEISSASGPSPWLDFMVRPSAKKVSRSAGPAPEPSTERPSCFSPPLDDFCAGLGLGAGQACGGPSPIGALSLLREAASGARGLGGRTGGSLKVDGSFGLSASYEPGPPSAGRPEPPKAAVPPLKADMPGEAKLPLKSCGSSLASSRPDNVGSGSPCCYPEPKGSETEGPTSTPVPGPEPLGAAPAPATSTPDSATPGAASKPMTLQFTGTGTVLPC